MNRVAIGRAVAMATILVATSVAAAKDRGITNTSSSPHVKLRSVDLDDVTWTAGFWAERFELCHKVMIPSMRRALLDPRNAAQLNRLRVAAGLQEEGAGGTNWADGDCYKWLETCAHVYAVTKDPQLDTLMDRWIDVIGRAQDPDGYISTNIGHDRQARLQLPYRHEMYNMGHLLTAACIHHRATGKDNFLRIARKLGDYLYTQFHPRPPRLVHFGWNPSQIMGLVELYRTTRDRRYLELARIFVDNRGTVPGTDHRVGGTDQTQDRVPLRKETEAVGHAVCGMYLYCGAADVCAEMGEPELRTALQRIWTGVTARKMDVTGGVAYGNVRSPRGDECHEAFGPDYLLPNGYNETCANIGHGMWSWRMLTLTGDAKYADVLETVIYNSLLAAVDLKGKEFFYCNPLVWQGGPGERHHTGVRWFVHSCYCCPPQVARTIAKLHGWAYSISDEGVWVNLYGGNRLQTELPNGSVVALRQETDYPWKADVKITIEKTPSARWSIMLRIPGWAEKADVKVNGRAADARPHPGTYLALDRRWSPGDVIELDLPMEVRLMEAHPKVDKLRDYVAAMRGPIVYCLELPESDGGARRWREGVFLPENAALKARFTKHFGGVIVLDGKALTHAGKDRFVRESRDADPPPSRADWSDKLYRRMQPRKLPPAEEEIVDVTLIPYYARANRGTAYMEVWIPLAR